MTVFSKRYPSFYSWLKGADRSTSYGRRIQKLHELAPDLTLAELQKAKIRELSPASRPFSELSADERDLRKRALLVLAGMRKGKSLTNSSQEQGITPKQAKTQLGNAIYKVKGRWFRSKD